LNLPNVSGVVAAPWAADLERRECAKLLLFANYRDKLLWAVLKQFAVEMSRR
jgi:hypothetical protein